MEDEESYFYDRLNYYLDIGAIEISGLDDDGEVVYEIKESAKGLAPELWESHTNYIDKSLISLFEQGIIEVEYNEKLEAIISISRDALDMVKEMGLLDPNFDPDKDGYENPGD